MSTVAGMSGTQFIVTVKSVDLEAGPTGLVPTEQMTFDRLASARSMAARMLVKSRERGWECFPMGTADPYAWCVLGDEFVHFITIEATGDDHGSTD